MARVYDVASVSAPPKARSESSTGLVAAERQSLAEHVRSLRGAHAYRSDCAAVFRFELQRRLYRVRVEGVHYAFYTLAPEISGLGIELHVVGVRHLFYKYKYLHVVHV